MRVSTQAYIERIRARLDEGLPESLLYAALELRCGVEGRLKSYLAPLVHLPKAKQKEWQIDKMNRTLREAFKSDNLIAILQIVYEENVEPLTLQYIPVSKQLRDIARRAGDWLHYPGDRAHDAAWFDSIRGEIVEGLAWLEYAATGELSGVPLIHSVTKRTSLELQFQADDPRGKIFERLKQGSTHMIRVDYKEMPAQPGAPGRLLGSTSSVRG